MKGLEEILNAIEPLDEEWLVRAQVRLDSLTKPVGSLGKLEEIARRYGAIKKNLAPSTARKMIVAFAGDHGVTEEAVSAYPQAVTVQMVKNMCAGGAAVNVLARQAGADVTVVDIGVRYDFSPCERLIAKKIGHGTKNFTAGPAMSRGEALCALMTGIGLAGDFARAGYDMIGTGEMGIGNTTASSAVFAVMAGLPPEEVTGRGTGIDENMLKRKIEAVKKAIAVNRPDRSDPLDVLAKVGGYEIGGIAGLIIGGAARRIPVVVDGFISTAGALIALALKETAGDYLFFSHLSAEAGHKGMLDYLRQAPIMDLDMRLGEGTGAAMAMMVIESALLVMKNMATFKSAGVEEKIRK
ncbi:MAG: nicotinate-nucleotide--dimethylbenzimidazole phosphoribosyltransferase [Syntrophales bacterium]|jgi:nicotinate-nucleotide--dimethylbenzimidazole phosphoribosyltransferase|nr:nicotinate-nucleotide--dimethylbenzimidazole phosphoribosyltransferase [Syntrophales bacterium]